MKIEVVLLAGGVGSRMNSVLPKQFIEIDGVPVIIHTLLNFENNYRITGITIVCLKDYIELTRELCKKYNIRKNW